MREEVVQITARDGRLLGGALSLPEGQPRAALLIAGANGVPHRFYAGTAAALAERGLAVLRFDYRGLATSKIVPARRETARMSDWGAVDIDGAIDWLGARVSGAPLHLLGHSAGGWLPGLAPSAERLDSIVSVASQSGYWRLWPWPERLAITTFWFAILPAAVAVFGYLPGWVLGGGESLPPGVAREWAHWGRRPDFAQRSSGPNGFEAFRGRLRAYAVVGDDFYAPRRAVEHFSRFYRQAKITEVRDFGRRAEERGAAGEKPKHFTVFSRTFRTALISELSAFLLPAG
ncbi:MAG: alpha/beta fold hydrolase [Acidobacteriota bacterium]